MTRVGINVARVLALAALVLGLSCCGNGSADGNGPTTNATPAQVSPTDTAAVKYERRKKVPSSGGCGAAVVRLGGAPGAIDFTLKCKPYRQREFMLLAVGLSPVSPGNEIRIRDFRQHPQIKEAGSSSRYGNCSRYGGGLACSARARALIVINGRLWVKSGSECDSRVGITESRPAQPCPGVCAANDAPAAVVVKMRPRGC